MDVQLAMEVLFVVLLVGFGFIFGYAVGLLDAYRKCKRG